jgi:uncharacterized protein YdaU (DUF1376 family)
VTRLTGLWWWIDRWRKSTAYTDMTLEEQGAYRNLLDEASLRGGPIPDDEYVLAKACGDQKRWLKVRPKVLSRFTLTADGWRNETLDGVLKESARRAANQVNYRTRRDNKRDNKRDNGGNNNHDNKPASPDPDPDPVKRDLKISLPKVPADPRVRTFLEWFQAEFKIRRHGADYAIAWEREGAIVKRLLKETTYERLQTLAQIMLSDKCEDSYIIDSDRSVQILSTKFNWLSERLAAWEAQHARQS